jgi:energy-coupling factor transport system permease protein
VTLILEPVADPAAPLARRNPVAKLGAALLFSLPLIATLDPLTPALALAVEICVLPFFGVRYRVLARRAWPLALAAVGILVTMVLFAADRSGALLVALGPFDVTTGVALGALGLVLRVFAVALPGIIVFATTDPTDLADALAQVLRLPHRFVLAALAAVRLFGVLAEEWQMLSLARRARGLGDDGWLGRLRTAGGQVFALLVLAIRRATTLATAMEARGFGASPRRTWARTSRFTASDAVVVLGGVVVAALATTAGVLAGSWQLLLT